MKRKRIRKILIIAFSVCLVAANVTSFSYAVDPVTFTEAETLGATIVDLYGAYNNTSLAYDQLSQSGALTEVVTLYNNYASNASDPYTLAAIGAAAAAAGAIAVIYDAVTGQGYVQLYQEQYISSLDGYWDYQLLDAGLVRDSLTGLFQWNTNQGGTVDPVQIYFQGVFGSSLPYSAWNNSPNAAKFNSGKLGWSSTNESYSFYTYSQNKESYVCLVLTTQSTTYDSYSVYYFAPYYTENQGIRKYSGNNYQNDAGGDANNHGNVYYTTNPTVIAISHSATINLPVFSTLQDAIDAFTSGDGKSIDIEPSIYIGDPLQNPVEITIPDPYSNDYVAQPRRIQTNIEWDPNWGTPVENPVPGVAYPITDPEILNDAVPGIWESIVSDGVEVGDPDPEPDDPGADANEVTIPFLPITLPSFNLNLSGIWHYVVTWVASLGAWFTTLFTIWSCLPYAMVVPVYATLVVVIVLGVYRRFLS